MAAILGEPLHAMVSTLGQTDATTDSRLDRRHGHERWPGRTSGPVPTRPATACRASASTSEAPKTPTTRRRSPTTRRRSPSRCTPPIRTGNPVVKLFDLVSPAAYEAGELHFFEAPRDTVLEPGTTYVMVWSHLAGTLHDLQLTAERSTRIPARCRASRSGNNFKLGSNLNTPGSHIITGSSSEDRRLRRGGAAQQVPGAPGLVPPAGRGQGRRPVPGGLRHLHRRVELTR